ncbi:MAG: SRPBCC family protein [Actinomycetota bacterium]
MTENVTDVDGELQQVGGRWRLRFTRRLGHPPEKVWRALTEPEHLAAWFPQVIEGERNPGARLRFVHRGREAPPFVGEMLVYDRPRVLAFRWGDDTLRFELAPEGAGCVLTLLDTFDERGKAARDSAGWHECLDLLAHHLAGERPIWQPGERWQQVHPLYVERFGPEAATIGPPD